jgi:CBS domain-containing protein
MKLREIMTPDVEVLSPNDTLQHAAQRLRDLDIGLMPACDGERLIGMLSDRDIAIRAVADGCDPSRTRVRDVMTPEVHYAFEDQDVDEAAAVMSRHQIRRLPVLNRGKRLVGIVALGDFAVRTEDEQLSSEVLEDVSEPSPLHHTGSQR